MKKNLLIYFFVIFAICFCLPGYVTVDSLGAEKDLVQTANLTDRENGKNLSIISAYDNFTVASSSFGVPGEELGTGGFYLSIDAENNAGSNPSEEQQANDTQFADLILSIIPDQMPSEPATMLIFGTGLVFLAGFARRRLSGKV